MTNGRIHKPIPALRGGCFTRVPNAVLDALISSRTGLTKNELQLALAVIRKTYGFSKSSDQISTTQFEKLTAINARAVRRCLKRLEGKNVLIVLRGHSRKSKRAKEWEIEKNIKQWLKTSIEDDADQRTKDDHNQRTKPSNTERTIQRTTKETKTKEILKERGVTEKRSKFDRDEVRYEN